MGVRSGEPAVRCFNGQTQHRTQFRSKDDEDDDDDDDDDDDHSNPLINSISLLLIL